MYKQLYKSIIELAKSENRKKNTEIYYESHHIVPEFMFKNRKRTGPAGHLDGSPDSIDNLVLLTFQEHLMAHYYLYEIYKDTRYGYSTGTALQFFFVKATSNHIRQRTLSEVDRQFLEEMAHLRKIGIKSISKARLGKMPAVDAITKKKIGSVPVDHPKVISGEWVHHSTGRKSPGSGQNQQGINNTNYRKMTSYHIKKIYQCLENSLVDNEYFSRQLFLKNIKEQFMEFKKISERWVYNNFGSPAALVEKYNSDNNKNIKYNPYYRSTAQRKLLSIVGSNQSWVTNGKNNIRLLKSEINKFLVKNKEYYNGRTHA